MITKLKLTDKVFSYRDTGKQVEDHLVVEDSKGKRYLKFTATDSNAPDTTDKTFFAYGDIDDTLLVKKFIGALLNTSMFKDGKLRFREVLDDSDSTSIEDLMGNLHGLVFKKRTRPFFEFLYDLVCTK